MSSYIEAVKENDYVRATVGAVRSVYAWTSEYVWPVYSTGMVLSVICIFAAAQEKQTLADQLYGSNKRFAASKDEIVADAKELLETESVVSVKHSVWTMKKDEFEQEYRSRHE